MQIGAYKNECTDLLGLRVSLPSWWVCKRLLLLGVWPNLVALDSISTNCRLLMQPYGFTAHKCVFFWGQMNFEHSQFLRALKNVEGWGSARFGERAIICNPYGASPLSPHLRSLYCYPLGTVECSWKKAYIYDPFLRDGGAQKKEFVFCCYFVLYFLFWIHCNYLATLFGVRTILRTHAVLRIAHTQAQVPPGGIIWWGLGVLYIIIFKIM